MSSQNRGRLLSLVALAAVVVGVSVVVLQVRKRAVLANETATAITDQLAELDPLTRAAVIAKLGAEATNQVKNAVR